MCPILRTVSHAPTLAPWRARGFVRNGCRAVGAAPLRPAARLDETLACAAGWSVEAPLAGYPADVCGRPRHHRHRPVVSARSAAAAFAAAAGARADQSIDHLFAAVRVACSAPAVASHRLAAIELRLGANSHRAGTGADRPVGLFADAPWSGFMANHRQSTSWREDD